MAHRRLRWRVPALLLAIGVLAACAGGSDGAAPTAAPATLAPAAVNAAPDVVATAAPSEEAAATAPAEAAAPAAPVDWLRTASVEGDYFVLGNPDAPVRILDYSDFL